MAQEHSLREAALATLPRANSAQLPTSSQSDTILAFYLFILFVIREAGVFAGSRGAWDSVGAQRRLSAHFFNQQVDMD